MGKNTFDIEDVARICHEANKTLCEAVGDDSQEAWELAPEWQRQSAIDGVDFHLRNPEALPSDSHDNWRKDKVVAGWTYGTIKDTEAKTHPCMVPFNALPPEQQAKDHLFAGIVNSMRDFVVQA